MTVKIKFYYPLLTSYSKFWILEFGSAVSLLSTLALQKVVWWALPTKYHQSRLLTVGHAHPTYAYSAQLMGASRCYAEAEADTQSAAIA